MNKELSLSASVQIRFRNQFRAQSDLVTIWYLAEF